MVSVSDCHIRTGWKTIWNKLEKYNIWVACLASWKTSPYMYSKGSLDHLSAKVIAWSWHDAQLSFLPMYCCWQDEDCQWSAPSVTSLYREKKKKPRRSQSCWPQRIVQQSIGSFDSLYRRHLFCSARGARQTNLSFFFFCHRNCCLCFFPLSGDVCALNNLIGRSCKVTILSSFKFPLKNCCPHDTIKKPAIIRTVSRNWIFCTRDCRSLCQAP